VSHPPYPSRQKLHPEADERKAARLRRGQGRSVTGTLIRPASGVGVSATFPGRPQEVRRVRAVLQPLLQGCPAAHEVVLCASELATNALLHSDTRQAGGTFTVRAQIRSGESVTLEVEDDGGWCADARPDPNCGRGLDIVEALADECGVCDYGRSRVVWARFGWPAALGATTGHTRHNIGAHYRCKATSGYKPTESRCPVRSGLRVSGSIGLAGHAHRLYSPHSG
jgi:anti-sigma regulatory factor (Ser/Thr protein kinase)